MYKQHRVAVVMPVHNERSQVANAIRCVPRYVDLIVAVDDGSDDGTGDVLSRADDRRLVILRHDVNRGVGAATRSGYRYALETGADLIAVMDGDGQMDRRDLWRLLDCAISGVDYVKGNRFLHPESISTMPLCRYIGNRLLSWLTRRAAGSDMNLDAQCGYTVIRRTALRCLNLDRFYDRYGFLNELLFDVVRAGLRIQSVPVRTIYAAEVSGINPLVSVPVILFLIARGFIRFRLKSLLARVVAPGTAETAATENEY